MKVTAILSILLALPAVANDAWVNFVRQNQVKSGVVWDMPVDAQGNGPSALVLEEDGALFQLWTIKKEDFSDYLLDQKVVGTYLPGAEIRITTGDPYPHVHRTRADQPFTVEVDVNGLLSGVGIPDAAKRVLMEHLLASYSEGQTSVDQRIATGGTPESSGYLTSNGTQVMQFTASSLKATDPTQAMGEEHFVIHSLPDLDAPQTQIASNYVQVWPVAHGSITGLEPGQIVRFEVPEIQVHLGNLYPSSTTYVQIYRGAPQLEVDGAKVEGTVLVLDQDTKEDRILSVNDWDTAITAEGQHTMEIVTVTPFGAERLHYISFEIDRELAINAQLNDFESRQ